MPTYEYKCPDCGNKFERFQPITAAPIKVCPQCGKKKVQRLIGMGAGLIFKGSGFYITDYRSEGYKEKAKSESGATTDSKPADGASSGESKSPAKTETAPAKSETSAAPKSEPKPAKSESKKPGKKDR
jgi:putative FmdB family regulatory protein